MLNTRLFKAVASTCFQFLPIKLLTNKNTVVLPMNATSFHSSFFFSTIDCKSFSGSFPTFSTLHIILSSSFWSKAGSMGSFSVVNSMTWWSETECSFVSDIPQDGPVYVILFRQLKKSNLNLFFLQHPKPSCVSGVDRHHCLSRHRHKDLSIS